MYFSHRALFSFLFGDLFALMSILSQSLLALVSRHLVSLMLLSVWHNFNNFYGLILCCSNLSACKITTFC